MKKDLLPAAFLMMTTAILTACSQEINAGQNSSYGNNPGGNEIPAGINCERQKPFGGDKDAFFNCKRVSPSDGGSNTFSYGNSNTDNGNPTTDETQAILHPSEITGVRNAQGYIVGYLKAHQASSCAMVQDGTAGETALFLNNQNSGEGEFIGYEFNPQTGGWSTYMLIPNIANDRQDDSATQMNWWQNGDYAPKNDSWVCEYPTN